MAGMHMHGLHGAGSIQDINSYAHVQQAGTTWVQTNILLWYLGLVMYDVGTRDQQKNPVKRF